MLKCIFAIILDPQRLEYDLEGYFPGLSLVCDKYQICSLLYSVDASTRDT